MSNYLKRAVQKVLVQKRHRIYKERIARQAVPYGVWMKELMEQEKAEITEWQKSREKVKAAGLTVSVLSREAFCESVLRQGGEGETGDIWLVASDISGLPQEAAREAERYFLEHPACGIAYGDESDYLKPGWSPDLLLSFFYFGNVFAVRRTLAGKAAEKVRGRRHLYGGKLPWEADEEVEGLRRPHDGELSGEAAEEGEGRGGLQGEKLPGAEDGNEPDALLLKRMLYDTVLCCIDEAKEAGHIEKILFLAEQTGKDAEPDWGREIEFDVIKRGHLYSDVVIPAEREAQKLVSVIIPSKDNPAVLSKCIHSLWEQTDYQNIEIIVVDNGSSDENREKILKINGQLKEEYAFRYFYRPMPFNFSAMCNMGAREARGEFLLFLNDDMEIVEENWLRLMLGKASKGYVGAVGAKLLYPDSDKIQHLGITSIHLGPAHELQFSLDHRYHYHGYNRCAVNVSGVTGACMLVRREVFDKTEGFSEKLQVAFNDVEFCFQLLRLGYTNVCCNDTYLYHHESLSRGLDEGVEKLARLHRERDLLYEMYPEMWNGDPYYSKRLVTDILDDGFKPACRFEEKRLSQKADAVRMETEMKEQWHNDHLYMGVEFAGDRRAWETGKSGGGDYYIQGWSYAVNVDNSRYKKSLLLKPMDRREEELWKVPYEECCRQDLEEKLPYIDHSALCGVSVWIPEDALPAGIYLIGWFWEDTCSRQKLYKFTADTLTVFDRREDRRGI